MNLLELHPHEVLEVLCEDSELLPSKFHFTDAGFDLKAKTTYTLFQGERVLVGTGVKVKIPRDFVGLLVARSSMSKRGLELTNSVGIIDSDYRGEIIASFRFVPNNFELRDKRYQTIEEYERIAQLLIVPVQLLLVKEFKGTAEEWNDTKRGEGGFGSTGK